MIPLRWILALATLAVLTGCNAFGTVPQAFTTYDLGRPGDKVLRPAVSLRLIEVRAPSWLGSSAMHYRFDDATDLRRRIYTENRWAAAPTEMIEAVLKRALSLAHAEGAGCLLQVEVDEFSQIFTSPTRSHGALAARAQLVSPRGGAVMAEGRLNYQVPAAHANAAGGARALREATLQLVDGLADWLDSLERVRGAGPDIAAACR